MRVAPLKFDHVISNLTYALSRAPVVSNGEWQAIVNDSMPQAETLEVEDVSFAIEIPRGIAELQTVVSPNLPWAEDHFQERISGLPLNPPPSSSWWPFAQRDNQEFKDDEKFSHTYPERFWPKYAGESPYAREGIRYSYGDLSDVVSLLKDRPGTRQAYLPVWFPEDTGAAFEQRVPCTLGYHFMVRNGKLKIVYYIRSCDFYRHFRDDVYMAARLGQWVADRVDAEPDRLVMHISSLHIFSAERGRITTELGQIRYKESQVVRS